MTHEQEIPAGVKMPISEYIGRVIHILDKAEGIRLEAQQRANQLHDLTQLLEDPTSAIGDAGKYPTLIAEFKVHARELAKVAESFDIDAKPLRDFISTHHPDLVTPASDVLYKLQGQAMKREREASVDPPASGANHSEDFTSVNWYGTSYTFSKGNQAESVRVLWDAWEAGGHSLSQETIKEKIKSSAERFELRKTFLRHPAWGTMIMDVGKGMYRLAPPVQE